MANYDSSKVGVPYVRITSILIDYGTDGKVNVTAQQEMSVKLLDNSIAILHPMPPIVFGVDLATQGSEKNQLVHPTTGDYLGKDVTNNELMLSMLAALRSKQVQQNA